jgi:methenyltetrahydrofolate cyclohydrolase
MYVDRPLRYFMDRLASKSPEPGGGSVAALTGALAAALVSMVSNLTLDKDKYHDVQPQIRILLEQSEKVRIEMLDLMQKDTEVYGTLSKIYQMPCNTEADNAVRAAEIQKALKKACEVPFNIGIKSVEVAKLARQAAEIGNTTAVSDAGIAALLAKACAESAALNVKINLNSIKEAVYIKNTRSQMQDIVEKVAALEKTVIEITNHRIALKV